MVRDRRLLHRGLRLRPQPDLNRTWGVPCFWQLVADLPKTCAGTATPNVTPSVYGYEFTIRQGSMNETQWSCESRRRRAQRPYII